MTHRFRIVICAITGCLVWAPRSFLWAQGPETYRDAFAAWQSASANLEADAAKAGELLAAKTDAAAPAAVKFEQARKTFFEAQTAPFKQAAQRLEPIQLPAESPAAKADDEILATEDAALSKTIAALAGDPDQGIRQLRQSLEKERAALTLIREAESARKAAISAIESSGDAAEHARTGALQDLNAMAASFQKSADEETKLADEWPTYYRSLAEGARGKAPAPGSSTSSVARPAGPATAAANGTPPGAPASPVNITNPATPDAAASNAGVTITSPAAANPAPAAASSSGAVQPPVPLARYTGAWGFTQGVSTFTGEQPTMFDVIVKVDNGQVQGMLSAAFIVGPSRQPTVKFTFTGALQATRNQVFPLKMSDGTMGTVQLIPGPAFNLLEVKFNLDMAPNKVAASDVTLLKK